MSVFDFGYNAVNQITQRDVTNSLYSWQGLSPHTTASSYNGLNQPTSIKGVAISHDLNGNLTGDGAALIIEYGDSLDLASTWLE